ncbi:MAG: sulfide-dependent adenosine diphosphate thiazole synthase [bacterium]
MEKRQGLFANVTEADITKAIARSYLKQLEEYAQCDVVIVGAGPSGLMAGAELSRLGLKTLIVERNNYLGGGFWIGGYLMNKVTLREPGQEILKELNVPYEEAGEGLYVADGPYATSKLIAHACETGVKFLNLTQLDDLIVKNKRVTGVVINYAPVSAMPRQITCVDPVAIESKIVIDATGHDAVATKKLEERGMLKTKGMGLMYVQESEDAVVNLTSEVFPGLIVTGMAVSTTYGLPRMGPTFSGMLLSGKKAAEIVKAGIEKV